MVHSYGAVLTRRQDTTATPGLLLLHTLWDAFNDAHTLVLDHGEGLYPVARKRILGLLGAERDAAWAEAKRLKAELVAKERAGG